MQIDGFLMRRLNFILFKCDAGAAVNALYEMLYSSPTKQMIFGPGCSTEAEVLAQAAPAWNITTVGLCMQKHLALRFFFFFFFFFF